MPSQKRARQRAGRAARMAELQAAQRRRRRNTRVIPFVVVALAAVLALALLSVFSGGKTKNASNHATTTSAGVPSTTVPAAPTTVAATPPTLPPVTGGTKLTGATPCPSFTGNNPHVTSFAEPPPRCITAGKTYTETFHLNLGDVTVTFDTTKTPATANNFIVLSLYHYFDGTALFRTDTSIGIIQGGSPHTQSASDPGPGYTIPDEGTGFTYQPGDLVMARTNAPNSAGAQFFFCVTSACSALNGQGTYVVFAHVTSGLPLLQQILDSNVDENNGLGGAPGKLAYIETTTVTQS